MTLEEGIWSQLDVSLGAAALLGKLDGRPLRELRPTDAAIASCRELLELGAFELRGYIRALSASTPATNGFVTLKMPLLPHGLLALVPRGEREPLAAAEVAEQVAQVQDARLDVAVEASSAAGGRRAPARRSRA